MMDETVLPSRETAIATVRQFNRFYTRQIGLLAETLLKSPFSLTEARVLYELARAEAPLSSRWLCQALLVDAGFMSRILKDFVARGLVTRAPSDEDGRVVLFALTEAGRAAFAPLDRASEADVGAAIGTLDPAQLGELVRSMQTVERLMGDAGAPEAIVLRGMRIGDAGLIASRQAVIYAREYGWDATYEALAAEILASFVKNHDPAWERAWIAERAGEMVGSVFVVRGSETVAKLRLLYVEPHVRGTGLGRRLVDTCIGFAREKGYRKLTLWTNDVLVPARRIYKAAGFVCVKREPHRSFGHDLVGETWDLAL